MFENSSCIELNTAKHRFLPELSIFKVGVAREGGPVERNVAPEGRAVEPSIAAKGGAAEQSATVKVGIIEVSVTLKGGADEEDVEREGDGGVRGGVLKDGVFE